MIGLRSREAYFKCIEKGSALTLEEAIGIAQNEEATASQVGYMWPEFKGGLTHAAVHQLHEKQRARPKQKKQQKEEVGQTIKNGPKEKTVSIVEQILRIQGVNALQRTQSVLSVEKREIIAVLASPKAKEGMLTSYKPSLSMRP